MAAIDRSKVFTSPNGKYDIVVCHNATDAQMYVNESGYAFPSHFSVDWDDLLFVNRKGIMTIE